MIAFTAIFLRLYARWEKRSFHKDDILMAILSFHLIFYSIFISLQDGFGRNAWEMEPEKVSSALKVRTFFSPKFQIPHPTSLPPQSYGSPESRLVSYHRRRLLQHHISSCQDLYALILPSNLSGSRDENPLACPSGLDLVHRDHHLRTRDHAMSASGL